MTTYFVRSVLSHLYFDYNPQSFRESFKEHIPSIISNLIAGLHLLKEAGQENSGLIYILSILEKLAPYSETDKTDLIYDLTELSSSDDNDIKSFAEKTLKAINEMRVLRTRGIN